MNSHLDLKIDEKVKSFLIPKRFYAYYKRSKGLRGGESELRLLPYLVDPVRQSIDIGANKGVYTYALGPLSQHVHAFEPNPCVYAFLKERVPKNATVYPVALSNRAADTVFRVPKNAKGNLSNQGGTLVTENVATSFVEISVTTARLDDFNLRNIGFIKIDVEGHERAVLEGALGTLEREKPTLLVEIEQSHTHRSIMEDIRWVESLGYRAFAFFGGKTLKSIDFFNPETHHIKHPGQKNNQYMYNFIFFPDA